MPEESAPRDSTESRDTELKRLRAQTSEQAALIEQLRQRIEDLEARLAKDSHNSSEPPSSDPPFKKPPPRSQRQPSGRKPGGQKGHRGATRTLVEDPDHRVIVALTGACDCGRCRAQIATEVLPERRQVVELVIRREVTEYRIVGGICAYGRVQRSAFPDGVEAPVQYGPGVSAFAVYMTQYQLLPLPDKLEAFEAMVHERMPERHLLDMLKHAHHWAGYTRHFGPPSGSDPKLEDAIKCYLFTVFGYGCNLGASQTAQHTADVNRFAIRRINAQHITTPKLEAAMNDVIAENVRFDLPDLWGDRKVVIADGTHVELRENNPLGERHIRYGKYGGINYQHISGTYIALFTKFIACGVWEAVYILDALLEQRSELQPDTSHADTHGQSEPVFGLALLLGIDLFPRMRTWNDAVFYRPSKTESYKHIDALFSKRRANRVDCCRRRTWRSFCVAACAPSGVLSARCASAMGS